MSFHGSYRHNDVKFLLKPLPLMQFTKLSEKELLIQTGQRHYSEMLSPESLPSAAYSDVFQVACANNSGKMASDCLALASILHQRKGNNITLVSLVRAGTPVGVILKHILSQHFSCEAAHYSISIIRDRGIDDVALQYILAQGHADTSIVFIDGWTGKGVISRELAHTIAAFNHEHGTAIDHGLYVLADLAGTATCAASNDDYLIPSSILNATISGLVSRSILNSSIEEGDFHGCVYYDEFLPHDQSIPFADNIVAIASRLFADQGVNEAKPIDRVSTAKISSDCTSKIMQSHGISDINLVKPGIGEATRVLLRRVPKVLILKNPESRDVQHLCVLAKEKLVPVEIDVNLPYQAVAIIRSALDG